MDSKFKIININHLEGDALKWAVLKAAGYVPAVLDKWKMGHRAAEDVIHSKHYVDRNCYTSTFSKVDILDWAVGGPMMERLRIGAIYEEFFSNGYSEPSTHRQWTASVTRPGSAGQPPVKVSATGEIKLLAEMRCYVALIFEATEIDVPAQFFQS